jgi:hypothetical protein
LPEGGCLGQLFGIARDVDRRDAARFDFQRGCLQRAVALETHEARQAVDPCPAQQNGRRLGELAVQPAEQPQDLVQPGDGLQEGVCLAAAIGLQDNILGQYGLQPREIGFAAA